jgi:hypothetical protein
MNPSRISPQLQPALTARFTSFARQSSLRLRMEI